MRGISHEGWAWAWTHGFKQPAKPLLRDEPPTCFFPLVPTPRFCARVLFASRISHCSRALRPVPLNQSRQIVVI